VQKFWPILFGVVLTAAGALFALAPLFGWWLPHNVCSFGPQVDYLFYLILIITGFFYILVEALLVYALWRYAAKPGHKGDFVHGSHKVELLWTIVPAVILLFIAFAQVQAWAEIKYQSRMPTPDQVFEVSARQFEWRFRYPSKPTMEKLLSEWKGSAEPESARKWDANPDFDDVHVVDEVHTWKGAKIRFNLKTRDVIHSFFLPNMRIKQDALPGKIIPVWFDAQDSNTEGYNEKTREWDIQKDKVWELACAELCGWGHYKMRGKVWVHKDKAEYEQWLEHASREERATQPEGQPGQP
jgi:cytochrome c oxidase subunit 2